MTSLPSKDRENQQRKPPGVDRAARRTFLMSGFTQ